jgi:hypothetical protein
MSRGFILACFLPRKFVFIPDGPFEFPQKLAAMTGTSALQALADLGALDLGGVGR